MSQASAIGQRDDTHANERAQKIAGHNSLQHQKGLKALVPKHRADAVQKPARLHLGGQQKSQKGETQSK